MSSFFDFPIGRSFFLGTTRSFRWKFKTPRRWWKVRDRSPFPQTMHERFRFRKSRLPSLKPTFFMGHPPKLMVFMTKNRCFSRATLVSLPGGEGPIFFWGGISCTRMILTGWWCRTFPFFIDRERFFEWKKTLVCEWGVAELLGVGQYLLDLRIFLHLPFFQFLQINMCWNDGFCVETIINGWYISSISYLSCSGKSSISSTDYSGSCKLVLGNI